MAFFILALVSLVMCYEVQAQRLPCSTPALQKLYKLGLQIRDLHQKLDEISRDREWFMNQFPTMKSSDDCGGLAHQVDSALELAETVKQLPEDLRLVVDEFLNELEMQSYFLNNYLNPKSKFCQLAYEKLAEVAKKAKPLAEWMSISGYPDVHFSERMQTFLRVFEKVDKTRCNHVFYAVRKGTFDWNEFRYLGKEQLAKIPTEKQKMVEDLNQLHKKMKEEINDLWAIKSQPA